MAFWRWFSFSLSVGYVNSLEGIIGHLFSFSVIGTLGFQSSFPQKKTWTPKHPDLQGPPPSLECLIWAERTGGTSGTAALRVEMDCEAELQDVGLPKKPWELRDEDLCEKIVAFRCSFSLFWWENLCERSGVFTGRQFRKCWCVAW